MTKCSSESIARLRFLLRKRADYSAYAILPMVAPRRGVYKVVAAQATTFTTIEPKGTTMKLTSWPGAALCALTMMLTTAPALASGALDGKRFDGVFMERGKTSGDADTLTFRDGRFRSSACDKYGYSDAAYKTSTQGDTTVLKPRPRARVTASCYGRAPCAARSSTRR